MITSPIGLAWSSTKPNGERSAPRSSSLAPRRPSSSATVNTSSIPAAAAPRRARAASSSRTATAALLSAPRIVSPRLRKTPSSSSTSIGPSCGHRVEVGAEHHPALPRPGTRAIRLPAPARAGSAASSSLTSTPSARSSASTASATSRSAPVGLGSRRAATKRSSRRWFAHRPRLLVGLSAASDADEVLHPHEPPLAQSTSHARLLVEVDAALPAAPEDPIRRRVRVDPPSARSSSISSFQESNCSSISADPARGRPSVAAIDTCSVSVRVNLDLGVDLLGIDLAVARVPAPPDVADHLRVVAHPATGYASRRPAQASPVATG